MKKEVIKFLSICLPLASCDYRTKQAENEIKKTDPNLIVEFDSVNSSSTLIIKPQLGLSKYIDHMNKENYLIDTNRLNKIPAWKTAANSPKKIDTGIPIVLLDFPVKSFRDHFTNPKTYFFAKWDTIDSTFKNGNDFLLMTWEIDSIGIKKELTIYKSLTQHMGNFPCFCFRDSNKVYALCHRTSYMAKHTLAETKKIRSYVNPMAPIYGYYDARKIEE